LYFFFSATVGLMLFQLFGAKAYFCKLPNIWDIFLPFMTSSIKDGGIQAGGIITSLHDVM
jgi:hypothetical protein